MQKGERRENGEVVEVVENASFTVDYGTQDWRAVGEAQ
jgi:hypothetical protein